MNSIERKPRNRKRAICFTAVFSLVVLFLIFSPIIFGDKTSDVFNPCELYTFEQDYTEPDGTVAHVYASGDSDFRYYHDENGYILTTDGEGFLRYAKNADGRIEDSGLRWNASTLQKSFIDKMTAEDLVREKNPQLSTAHADTEEHPSVFSDSRGNTVYNVVIFIAFADSRLTEADIPIEIKETFSNDSGTYNSLRNYFAAQTAGEKQIVNLFAYEYGALYVYVSPNDRSYYSLTLTEKTRIKRERELLTSAAAAFNEADKDDVIPEDLDSNGDGYADAVSFVILDKPVSTQGSILWPHKWHMASISGSADICGVPIGVYSLNFTASHFVTFAHETGHVLGAPDYYASSNNAMPLVAEWDVMSITKKTGSPANMLAYTRKKYMGMNSGVIETVRAGQTVTLKNAADIKGDDVLAVRIPTAVDGVYVYAEYRAKAAADEFDGGQQSGGLIVYRVNENVGGYGNINARNISDYSNIEVFVYRKGGANNLDAVYSAALNENSETGFNDLGSGTDTPLTVNANTVLDACFSDVWENGDGTVSFTVNGDGIKSDYDGEFTIKGAVAADWTYYARAGERFTIEIGQVMPTSQGTVRAFLDYDETSLGIVSSSGLSTTFEVSPSAASVENVTVRIRDGLSSCQMTFAVITDGSVARKAEVVEGTESPLFLGDGWENVTAIGLFDGEGMALKDITPLAFNAWSGDGLRRVHFFYGEELYYYDVTVADRAVYAETEVEEVSVLVGETLPETLSVTVHFASGASRTVTVGECEINGFDSSAVGTETVFLSYRDEVSGTQADAELKVSVARPTGAEIVGTATEYGGKIYPTAELVSSDGTINFGDTVVVYYLDYGTERVKVRATYGDSGKKDWFTVDFADASLLEGGIFTAVVRVYRNANGRVSSVIKLENIEFRILKAINRVSIMLNGKAEEEDGHDIIYLEDRENWELFWRVEYFDGSTENAAVTVRDSDIELDKPYLFAPEYLGHETEGIPLIIRNTAVGVACDATESFWGEPLSISPYAVMADGTKKALSDGDWRFAEGSVFDVRGEIGVAQSLTVELNESSGLVKKGGSVSSEITVTPIDGLKSIELVDYKKEYEFGEEVFAVRYLRTVNYSGKTELVSPTLNDISVSGFDTAIIVGTDYSCSQTVEVGYADKYVEVEIRIINPIISARLIGLSFDGEAGAYVKFMTDAQPFRLSVAYKNEASEIIECEPMAVDGYDCGTVGKYAAVFKIEKENTLIYSAAANVLNCIANVRSATIIENSTGNAPEVIDLRFGEAVDLEKFRVKYTADSGAVSLGLMETVAYTATKNYSSKRETGGLTTVDIRVPVLREASGKAVSFTVRINVAPRVNDRILSVVSTASVAEVKHGGKIIVLRNETTVAELMNILKSDYLLLRYKGGAADDFAGGYSTVGGVRVFDTVELRNAEGTLIESYKVCLVGDADGDGRVSSEDITAFAKQILANSTEIYDHEAAGGSLNLKSFVQMIASQKEKGESI